MTSKVQFYVRAMCAAALSVVLCGLAVSSASAAAPTPTAADPGLPDSIAVIGDSMSAATGTAGIPASEQPQNSWSTGTNASVNSLYQRLLAINPSISGKNYNLASNGEDMLDGPAMANSAPLDTQLVTLQLGGNNLCKSNVASMTTVEEYRNKFIETLNILADRVPGALIQIQSVPDIYNLWFLRGAPNPPNDQPSSRAGTARLFWGLGLIPCESLVTNATSMAQADIDRRDAVRARNIAYNKILAEECEARLRCRFDRYATFNFSSNRSSPPEGPYAPRNTWQFVDDDISTIDHFHPSLSGQTKMAQAAWESGYNFADSTMPTSLQSILPAPTSGVNFVAPTVTHTWSDSGGIKGVQYRTHHNDVVSDWQTAAGSTDVAYNQSQPYSYLTQKAVSVPVTEQGITYVETRAMDANGNLSASRVTTVNFDPGQIPAPNVTSGPPANSNSSSASFAFSGAPAGSTYQCSLDGSSFSTCTSPRAYAALSDGPHEFQVRINTAHGNGPAATRSWSVDTVAPAAPQLNGGPATPTNQSSASFTFTGEAGGSFECSLNGAPFTACSSPSGLNGLAEGDRQFEVRQIDAAGNVGSPATHSWKIDTTVPAAPLLSGGPANKTSQTGAEFTFTGESGAVFECSLDDSNYRPCESPITVIDLEDGDHKFEVRQVDQAGNRSADSTHNWGVDATPPAAPTLPPSTDEIRLSLNQAITFTGESGGSFECRIEQGPWAVCSSPWQVTFPGDGKRSFQVRQTDEVGNVGPEATGWMTFDTTPPLAPKVTSAPKRLVRSTSATVKFTVESGATASCRLDDRAWNPCPGTWTGRNLSQGTHKLEIRQSDLGGDGPVTTVTWTVDTVAPRLKGKVKAKGKPGRYVLTSAFATPQGKPASLEFSTAKKKPSAKKKPVKKQTRKWAKKLTVNSKKKPTWARIGDKVGNWSGWVKVG